MQNCNHKKFNVSHFVHNKYIWLNCLHSRNTQHTLQMLIVPQLNRRATNKVCVRRGTICFLLYVGLFRDALLTESVQIKIQLPLSERKIVPGINSFTALNCKATRTKRVLLHLSNKFYAKTHFSLIYCPIEWLSGMNDDVGAAILEEKPQQNTNYFTFFMVFKFESMFNNMH